MTLHKYFARLERQVGVISAELSPISNKVELSRAEVMIAERAIMQYQMAWEHYVRSVILSSSTGRFSDKFGRVHSTLPSPPKSVDEASRLLISMYPRSDKEPDWYLSIRAIDAATKLQLSNLATITNALGLTPWPIDELRFLRNFAAHRSKSSALKIRNQRLVRSRENVSVSKLVFQYDATGQQRFQTYASFIRLAAKKMLG